MLIFGDNDDAFIRTTYKRCSNEKNVTLNDKKLVIGFDTVPFVGHEISDGYKHVKKTYRKCNLFQLIDFHRSGQAN